MDPKVNPKVNPKTMKRYAKLWRWWTENPESGQEKVDKKHKKGGQKIRNDTQKTPKRQRMILKVKEMTQEAKDDTKNGENDTKNDTKNGTFTDDLQEVNNDAMNTHATKNDTKN